VVFLVVVPRLPAFFERFNYFWVVRGDGFPYWTYLSNWHSQLNTGTHRFLCVGWSLAIEEQYYLVWPLTVWFTSRRGLAIISVGLLGLSAGLRTYFLLALDWPAETVFSLTFCHLDGIALGSLLAMAWRDRVRYGALLDRFARLAAPLGIALFALVLYAGLTRREGTEHAYAPAMVLAFPLVALFYASVLVRSLTMPGWVRTIFSTPFLRMLGKYSYAAYLFQFAAAWLVDVVLGHAHARFAFVPVLDSPFGLLVRFALQVTAAYGLAALSWKVLEGPINAFKDRTPLLNPTSPPAPSAPDAPRLAPG
jgi:peptidoglycan/LPS O-acetylase OafA/YrhL